MLASFKRSRRLALRQQGFALFEVLAALIVLSVSFLGTAYLLANVAREQRSALFLNRAAVLAADMAERMRVSAGARAAYTLHADFSYQQAADTVPLMGNCGGLYAVPGAAPALLGDCTNRQEVAYYDVTTWINLVRYGLPGGAGFIFPPTAARSTHVVAVAWVEPMIDKAATGAPQAVNQRCASLPGAALAAPEHVRCFALEVQL
ncbi:MAG: type IV pilus modification protein PilV [Ideonella sp.]|nr:type IV pilus modification protein PilV [Ideonella sp.]